MEADEDSNFKTDKIKIHLDTTITREKRPKIKKRKKRNRYTNKSNGSLPIQINGNDDQTWWRKRGRT